MSAAHTSASSVAHTSFVGSMPSSGVAAVVALDDVAADEEGADDQRDGHDDGERSGLQVISFVSATAWRSASSSITRLSTSCS